MDKLLIALAYQPGIGSWYVVDYMVVVWDACIETVQDSAW